jgi:hypothetical protein
VGVPAALKEKKRPGNPRKLDGKQEAFLVALACSPAPEGRDHWTMQLLADKLVELQVVAGTLSADTVARRLKKRSQTLAKRAVVFAQPPGSRFCLADGGCSRLVW